METYFKIKTILEYGVPAVIIIGCIIVFACSFTAMTLKEKLMRRSGYTYYEGLGTHASYEYQPRWEKGDVHINYRVIERNSYKELKKYLKQKEGK